MTNQTLRNIGFRGVAEGVQDGLHARNVRNMYLDAGLVRKRHGYHQLVQFEGAVNGIFQVTVAGAAYVLVYAGTRFYLRRADEPEDSAYYRDITLSGTASTVDTSRLVNRRIAVYQHDDCAYIVGCGDYLVLKAVNDEVQLRRVEDEADTHVPTTAVGIGCVDNSYYVPTTVDAETVGTFYVRDEEHADGYAPVILDGDESLPEEGVAYYRRIVKAQLGTHLEDANLLSSYRINTLYGSDAGGTYRLDALRIDPDSETQVAVDVLEDGQVVHYDLTETDEGTVDRAPVVGDDLGGVTLRLTETAIGDVGSLHFGLTRQGNYALRAKGGYMRWQSTGTSDTAWNTASLLLHSGAVDLVVATATRSSFLMRYTVNWLSDTLQFPEGMGEILQMDSEFTRAAPHGSLPVLYSDLVYQNEQWGVIDYRNATITFTHPTTPAGLEDNITVRFKHRDCEQNADILTQAVYSTLYGVAGNADHLFMGGAECAPTTDFYSASGDWTYFTHMGTTEMGRQGAIEGYRQVGYSLVTLIRGHVNPNAYWRQGSWTSRTYTLGGADFELRRAVFGLVRTSVLPAVASGYGCAALGGNVLYLGEEGLYKLTANSLSDDVTAMRMSAPIRHVRWGPSAAAVVYDRRYLVSDGQAVYVADSRYRLKLDGDSNYEWTVWDIPHVRVWFRQADALYFGTDDGKLCAFAEDWQDVTFTDTEAGQLAVHAADNTLSVDQSLPLAAGDELHFNQTVYATLCPIVDISNQRIYVRESDILHIYDDTPVTLLVGDVVGQTVYIDNVDWGTCTFGFHDAEGAPYPVPTGLSGVLTDLSRTVVLVDEIERGAVSLCHPDGHRFSLYEGSLPATLTARIVRRTGVHAVYEWEPNALNTPDIVKQLLSVTVEASAVRDGAATISVRNSLDMRRSAVLGLSALDYRWLDLGHFSFDGDMRRSATARLKMRFQALCWRIDSDNAGDFALMGVCLRYRYIRNAKEVED